MHLGSRNAKAEYTMDKTKTSLATVTEGKDLMVITDDKLKFHKHVLAAVSKANQILDIVKRTFDTLDEELLSVVFKHYVRPQFEYGNVI